MNKNKTLNNCKVLLKKKKKKNRRKKNRNKKKIIIESFIGIQNYL